MHEHMHHFAGPAAPFWLILLAGVALVLISAPAGAVLLWRRQAYFGDALGHAAMLGVALMLALRLPVFAGVAVVALAVAGAVLRMARRRLLAHDALLGTFAHGLLAAGLLIAFLALGPEADLHAVLFGDMLHMTSLHAALLIIGALGAGALLWRFWPVLVLGAVSEELAQAEGWPLRRAQWLLFLSVAGLLALAAQATGLLLYSSLLIIPAAAARAMARTPEQMAGLALGIALISMLAGLALARSAQLPSGPAIVSVAFAMFVIFHMAAWLRRA